MYRFKLDFKVRDYECDMQGVVNNAVYQNYLEHTRHEFLKSVDLDFAEFTRRKIHLVVVRIELDYHKSLRGGDEFFVGLNLERISPLRFCFDQKIYRSKDHVLMLSAKVVATALNERNRPEIPVELEKLLSSL